MWQENFCNEMRVQLIKNEVENERNHISSTTKTYITWGYFIDVDIYSEGPFCTNENSVWIRYTEQVRLCIEI